MGLNNRVAVIGAGKMGGALLKGLVAAGVVRASRVVVADADAAAVRRAAKSCGVKAAASNAEAVRTADVVILAVKPKVMAEALASIRPVLRKGALVISIAAGVSTAFIERHLAAGVPVVRAMPNTPCLVGAGMTGICPGRSAKRAHLALADRIFSALGRVAVVSEKHMNAVTGLSGSGPAFMYSVLEGVAEGGTAAGLPAEVAVVLAAQTMLGAARMVLETGEAPGKLRDMVATPGGCTVEGLAELESGGARALLARTVVRAAKRAGELVSG